MKPSTRTATIVASVALCGATTLAFTQASAWPRLQSLLGEVQSPAKPLAPASAPASPPASASASSGGAPSPAASTSSPVQTASKTSTLHDGTYTGPRVDAYYGIVRVQVQIQGGRIASIHVLEYPSDNGTSRYINSIALPYLKSEVIQAQTVFVNMVSGATLSSNAFLRSTYAALQRARS